MVHIDNMASCVLLSFTCQDTTFTSFGAPLLAYSRPPLQYASNRSNLLRPILATTSSKPQRILASPFPPPSRPLLKSHFPPDFLFGSGTSAYQVEGAVRDDGRQACIWDTFSEVAGHIAGDATANIACDHYHKYKEDVKLMKEMGLDIYRFSIAWPRLFPDGGTTVNEQGLAFYDALIDEVLKAGLTPFATIYHWDLPQALEDDPNIKGWRSKSIVARYTLFAETCFKHFGDRVKHWSTFNEPHISTMYGWGIGTWAPGRCSAASGNVCAFGDSSTEPYLVMHNILLSHAAAVKIYRSKYQKEQGGVIGISCDIQWYEPFSQKDVDQAAAQRYLEFQAGWPLDPIMFGRYPQSMVDRVKDRLPKFSEEESKDLKGSTDFIGVNYYFALYAKDVPVVTDPKKKYIVNDVGAETVSSNEENAILGKPLKPDSLGRYLVPWGLRKLLRWLDARYGKVPLYITENGTSDADSNAPLPEGLKDDQRQEYVEQHLQALNQAIVDDKCNVKGYFVWSLMDNFEWTSGYTVRYGLFHVDFDHDDLTRSKKLSATWFSKFLANVPC